jgi:type IV secretion system protein VirB5
MKHLPHTLCAISLVCASPGAFAFGIPVIDIPNLLQAIQQVSAWGAQKAQMANQLRNQAQQINQLQSTLNSMTGNRGLGTVTNNVPLDAVVPTNAMDQLQRQRSAVDLVNQVKNMTNGGLNASQQRGQQIQALMSDINGTSDAKGVAEIQARITAENAAVGNDANRIAILDVQQRMAAERINNDLKAEDDAMVTSSARTSVDFTGLFKLGE